MTDYNKENETCKRKGHFSIEKNREFTKMTLAKILNNIDTSALMAAFPQGIVTIDVETTGLSPVVDKVIELSAVKLTPEGLETFDELIDPEIEIPQVTINIHGITQKMIEGKEKIETVLPKFLQFCGDLPLLAHNAKFDVGFLVFDIHKLGLKLPNSPVFCSIKLSRATFKESENHKLGTLATFLNIPLENHHRALDDAFASLLIFNEALKKGSKKSGGYLFNINNFSKLNEYEIPKKLQGIDKFLIKQTPIEIRYKGGSHKGKFREIKPVSILPMPTGLVLYAYCELDQMYKSFSLKKIAEYREVDK